ncbi:hypothetical protein [Robertmurraya massiliosenegalensis]|uniref:hypothetical protein n=1 Tax=Robertmurraya massiliosenegalensis TaxID=1287657 RepID=UPI00030C9964|nr:hypothetical protein [Robertmurraya massiliosenegalensis]
MEEILNQILNELKEMRVDISEVKGDVNEIRVDVNELKVDVNDLKQGQDRLEVGLEKLQKNLVESLDLYTDKIVNHVDDKIEVLNKRVFKVETEIERLTRQ